MAAASVAGVWFVEGGGSIPFFLMEATGIDGRMGRSGNGFQIANFKLQIGEFAQVSDNLQFEICKLKFI